MKWVKYRTQALLHFLQTPPASELNSSEWIVFLKVALDQGCTVKDVMQETNLSQQSVSRIVRNLSLTVTPGGRNGRHLLKTEQEGRFFTLWLDRGGADLFAALCTLHRTIDDQIAAACRAEMEGLCRN